MNMAEKIDVDKLKNEAFTAIDALFGDEDESETVSAVKDSDQPGDFDTLEEYILALDWEYTDKDITAFISQLETISGKYTDRYSQALVKLIKSIASYLYKAKGKAFPETLNVLAHVVKSLVKINTSNLDKIAAKAEVSAAYRKVATLKKKIEQYNSDFGYQQAGEPPEKPASTGPKEPESEDFVPETQDVEVVSSPDTFDFQQDEDTKIQVQEVETKPSEPVEEPVSDLFSNEPEPGNEPEEKSEPVTEADLEEPRKVAPDMDQKEILDRLAEFESRINYLEKQNKLLRQIVTQGYRSSENNFEESGPDFEEPSDQDSELESVTPASEIESITEDDIQYEDEFSWDLDITEDETGIGEEDIEEDLMKEPDETPFFTEEESFPSSSSTEEDALVFSEPEKEEYVEYVRFFQVNGRTVALPNSYINNVYKIPGKLKKTIQEETSVTLGDFASLSRKLSKNMKGGLQGMPTKQLKSLVATVHLLTQENTKYNYGVLCSCDDTYVMIPVSDHSKSGMTLITEIEKSENEYSQYCTQVADIGTTPVIFPC